MKAPRRPPQKISNETPNPTWITHAILYTQDRSRSLFKGHIRLEGSSIAEIRRSLPARLPRSARVIDASGLTIFPGFVQAHVHLCQTLFRNLADDMELLDWLSKRIWKFEAAHTFETLKTSARLGIYELLASGTTCLLDMGTVRHTEAIFETVRDSGIRANVGKCLMDHPTLTPPGLRESTDVALKEAIQLFNRWNGAENDRIRASFAPRFALSCTEELLREVGTLSRHTGATIHTHASENQKEIALVRKLSGKENIEYLASLGLTSPRLVLAHCVWLNAREKEILKRDGVSVAHCPSSNLKLASGIAPIPELLKKGINVALGADGAPCNNNLSLMNEMRLAALIHKPGHGPKTLPAEEVLDLATLGGARALGWQQKIGSIEVGKRADLVAIDLNCPENRAVAPLRNEAVASSLVYASQPQHLRWTMVDGKIVYKNGSASGLSRPALMQDVARAQSQILRKVRLG